MIATKSPTPFLRDVNFEFFISSESSFSGLGSDFQLHYTKKVTNFFNSSSRSSAAKSRMKEAGTILYISCSFFSQKDLRLANKFPLSVMTSCPGR